LRRFYSSCIETRRQQRSCPPPPLPTNLPFFYCASGTWATPFQGLPFDVGWRVEQMGLVRNQPVGCSVAGFLYPNPFLSYNESVADGVAELMRLIPMNAGQFYLCGYSQGDEVVVVRTLRADVARSAACAPRRRSAQGDHVRQPVAPARPDTAREQPARIRYLPYLYA